MSGLHSGSTTMSISASECLMHFFSSLNTAQYKAPLVNCWCEEKSICFWLLVWKPTCLLLWKSKRA